MKNEEEKAPASRSFSERFFGRLSGAGAPLNTHLLAAKGKNSSAEVDVAEPEAETPRRLDTRMHTAEFAALTTADLESDPEGEIGEEERGALPQSVTLGAVALGGAIGATFRYTFSLWIPTVVSVRLAGFDWAMLSANVLGCLIIGLVVGGLEARPDAPLWVRPLVVTGFCGGFTTVSAFSVYLAALLGGDYAENALLYGVVTIAVCLTVCALGLSLGRKVFQGKQVTA